MTGRTIPAPLERKSVALTDLITSHDAMKGVLDAYDSGRRSETPHAPLLLYPRDDMPGYEIGDGHHRVADAIRHGRTHLDADVENQPDEEQYDPPYYDFSKHMGVTKNSGLTQVGWTGEHVTYDRSADGESGQPGRGLGEPRSSHRGAPSRGLSGAAGLAREGAGGSGEGLTWHPQAVKDLKRLDRPVQKQVLDTLDSLKSGDPTTLAQTHPLHGVVKGWYATKASRGLRIIHRPNETGGIHVGYVGLHEYEKAQQRLAAGI